MFLMKARNAFEKPAAIGAARFDQHGNVTGSRHSVRFLS
jgi:hypothetical protein